MTLSSLAICIGDLTKIVDSVALYDDVKLSDEQRVLARLAIQHLVTAREYVEKLKAADR